jgi:hypothetical protein
MFNNLQHSILFKDIHFGLDIKKSFFNKAINYHPYNMEILSGNKIKLKNNYQNFQKKLISSYNNKYDNYLINENSIFNINNNKTKVLIIQRSKSRSILNLDDVIIIFDSIDIEVKIVDLDTISFALQMQAFKQIDILIAVAGSAIHNMLFMKPDTHVIIIMQKGWCNWSWMYINQAILLDINTYKYCDLNNNNKNITNNANIDGNSENSDEDNVNIDQLSYSKEMNHWTRKFWKQVIYNENNSIYYYSIYNELFFFDFLSILIRVRV